jgi:hypothetical protein
MPQRLLSPLCPLVWCAEGRAAVADNYITDIEVIVKVAQQCAVSCEFLGHI